MVHVIWRYWVVTKVGDVGGGKTSLRILIAGFYGGENVCDCGDRTRGRRVVRKHSWRQLGTEGPPPIPFAELMEVSRVSIEVAEAARTGHGSRVASRLACFETSGQEARQ